MNWKHRWQRASETLAVRANRAPEAALLHEARRGKDVCWLDEAATEPLVTIRITTFNRGRMVADRAIASALAQTYERIEVLVVGDNCDAATERAVRSVTDPRLRFINLGHRGLYPNDPARRWYVAGAAPMNAALYLAMGAWIAPCDDDDELTPEHVAVLLAEARRERLEMVYGKATCQTAEGQWNEIGEWPLRRGRISHGAVLYSLGLRNFTYRQTCWRAHEPADWNLWYRMAMAGVKMGFLDQVVYRHYREGPKK